LVLGRDRWRSNWRVVSPPGAVPVDLGGSAPERRALRQGVRTLPAGTPVVLFGSGPRAMRRCKTFASRTGVALDRGYLAFPSASAPGYLVEDAPASARAFVRTVLVAPPRTSWSTPIQVGLRVLRSPSPWRAIRLIAPGRVVVGRRT
jgi:hypothetical protein